MLYWLLLAADLLLPAIFWIIGWAFTSRPVVKMNYSFGYRTKRSMQNQETWEFAHRHIGHTWKLMGPIWMVISIIPMIFVYGRDINLIGNVSMVLMVAQVVAMLLSIIPTEKALKETFDDHGRRRK